jgi:gas vesicle protein
METKDTMDRDNQGTMWGWFLCGAALGGVVALLLAPKTGEQTRELLSGEAERGRRSLLETGQEVFERGRELFERGREIAEEAAQFIEKSRRIAEKRIEDRF